MKTEDLGRAISTITGIEVVGHGEPEAREVHLDVRYSGKGSDRYHCVGEEGNDTVSEVKCIQTDFSSGNRLLDLGW